MDLNYELTSQNMKKGMGFFLIILKVDSVLFCFQKIRKNMVSDVVTSVSDTIITHGHILSENQVETLKRY